MRFITYGYEMKNGKLFINEEESKYVEKIFELYEESGSIKTIKDYLNSNNVLYDKNIVGWNNRRINTILTNGKYVGFNNYPAIIDEKLFYDIQNKRRKVSRKILSNDSIILKKLVYCGNCGKQMIRVNKWDTREKWICNNGCKCKKYFDDKEILISVKRVLNIIKNNNDLIEAKGNNTKNKINNKITRNCYEVNKQLQRIDINYEIIKKIIIENADVRFVDCKLDKSLIYSSKVLERINNLEIDTLDIDAIQGIISKIYILSNTLIEVEFINGVKIREVSQWEQQQTE